MEITFLGTTAMVPTKERNHSGIFLKYKDEGILFDCGEGTQRQLKQFGIKITNINKILITHWHGDHILGLPGLLQSIFSTEGTEKIKIYGPIGSKKYFKSLMEGMASESEIKIEIKEVKNEKFFENDEFILETKSMKHTTECNAYTFIEKDKRKINIEKIKKLGIKEGPEIGQLQKGKTITHKGKKIQPDEVSTKIKGKKISYITDTRPTENCLEIAKDSDILICESTFKSDMEKKAHERTHMTAQDAGQIANQANAKKLILTHFSTRYKDTTEIEEDARNVFDNTICAYDGMKIKL
jgi:ribonuclease Z